MLAPSGFVSLWMKQTTNGVWLIFVLVTVIECPSVKFLSVKMFGFFPLGSIRKTVSVVSQEASIEMLMITGLIL